MLQVLKHIFVVTLKAEFSRVRAFPSFFFFFVSVRYGRLHYILTFNIDEQARWSNANTFDFRWNGREFESNQGRFHLICRTLLAQYSQPSGPVQKRALKQII